jgi:hypothetical protein
VDYRPQWATKSQLVTRSVNALPFLMHSDLHHLKVSFPRFRRFGHESPYRSLLWSFRLCIFLVLGSMEKGRMDGFGAR